MNSIDRNIPLDRGNYRSLHIIAAGYLLQSAKYDGMVGYDQVASAGDGLHDHLFGNVQRRKHARTFPASATGQQPGIVIRLLVRWRSHRIEKSDDIGNR